VSYVYLQTDDVSNIIIKDENSAGEPNDANWNYELAFYYLRSKQLDFVLWGRWKLDAEDEVVYQADRAMQFRFDSARGRWLAAGLDPPTTLATESYPNSGWALAGDMLFTDYLGDLPYNDGVLDQSTYAHSDATRYLGLAAERDISSGAETYYHGDLIDSTVLTTDAAADSDVRVAYTAFGEILTTGDPGEAGAPGGSAPEGAPRYQYAGGYGYESGLLALQGADTTLPPITLQHLGHRWYQPDSGRFVQRDPIGIAGGLNVYAYVRNAPGKHVDPTRPVRLVWPRRSAQATHSRPKATQPASDQRLHCRARSALVGAVLGGNLRWSRRGLWHAGSTKTRCRHGLLLRNAGRGLGFRFPVGECGRDILGLYLLRWGPPHWISVLQ